MLTESEKHWLRNKRLKGFRYDICRWCFAYPVAAWERAPSPCVIYCHNNGMPALCEGLHSARGLKDALEFEGRVAAKLAEFYHHTTLYLDDSDGQKLRCWETCPARYYCGDNYTHLNCGDAVLKTAQLAVEEEMDGK